MRIPHCLRALILVSCLLSLCFMSTASYSQADVSQREVSSHRDTARAIEVFEQGNAEEATKLLRAIVRNRPDDADAWYYLGLALNSQGFIASGRPAFEKFISLRPDSADGHAKLAFALIQANEPQKALASAQRALELGDQSAESHYAIAEASLRMGAPVKALEEANITLSLNPNFGAALITRSFAQSGMEMYPEAAESLRQFLDANPNDIDADTWRGQLEQVLERQYQVVNRVAAPALTSREVTQRARVLSKPEPQYTEAARLAGVTGTIVLRTIFSAEGDARNILIVKPLGYGLATQAVKAARQIRFTPAIKDGRPVSTYIQLEYGFHLY